MKNVALTFLFLAAFLPLRAAEQLQNTDFSDGVSQWEGNVESTANAGVGSNFTDGANSSDAGIVLKLAHNAWAQITQQFSPLTANGTLTVVYQLSDGLKFSPRPGAYKNIPKRLGYGSFPLFDSPPGSWVTLLVEAATVQMNDYEIAPNASTAVQTAEMDVKDMTPRGDQVLVLAFPPGDGTIMLYRVSLQTKP